MSDIEQIKIPKVGRNKKIDNKVKESLIYAYSIGCNDLQACLYAEITVPTLKKYEKDNPEFLYLKVQLKEHPILYASQVLFKGLKDKPAKNKLKRLI